jgi:hypothetical protein
MPRSILPLAATSGFALQDVGGSQGWRPSADCDRQPFSVVRIAREQHAVA